MAMTTVKKKTAGKKSSGEGQACWPGFKRVPGTEAGTKGSCEPKAKQTSAEKKADGRAAVASKRKKNGYIALYCSAWMLNVLGRFC